MCGRYSLAVPDPAQVRARFPVGESVEIRRRYNVAPTDDVLAVTTDRDGHPRGELLRWGLVPSWADSPKIGARMINARLESVAEKPAFRTAFRRYRCLIVADGFYEWRRADPAATHPRRAFHITRDDGAPFAFAGLWSIWHGPGDESLRTCTIITRPANERIAVLHDRMPVILDPRDEADWLDAATPEGALREMLAGLPAERTALTEVGRAVNDARHDAPDCLEPPAAPAPERLEPQPSLF
ncbi:MAG TPA: SOS response-associated peptidase [Solirubrobacteraceae bacterium]|nr:SOS response-associated peptidase [Solirubrobacteraceae bacterium]